MDYIANSNLIKYTILEKYNVEERLAQKYITEEDFQPLDAHNAKSMLTKNYFLAKLICLFGFHKYILYHRPRQMTNREIRDQASKEAAAAGSVLDQWKIQKKIKDSMNEKDADKFIKYSFRRNFMMNGRETELFEPPKILGDVFESLMGAIFLDGGLKKVLEVYQHLLAPFIVFTAKHSKALYKEPKDDFNRQANLLRIIPEWRHQEIEVASVESFTQALLASPDGDPKDSYILT